MTPRRSVVRSLLLAMLGTGLAMGLAFPLVVSPFADYRHGMLAVFSMLCVVAGLVVGSLNFLLVRIFMLRTIDKVSDQLGSLARGEGLGANRLELDSADGLGRLVEQFNALFDRLQQTMRRVIETVEAFVSNADETGNAARELVGGVDRKSQAVTGTATLFEGLRRELETMREILVKLQGTAGESGAAVARQVEQSLAINLQIDQLQRRNKTNAEGISRANVAIRRTGGHAALLSRSLEEAASSMVMMDISVREIESGLGNTAAITERVAADAGEGEESVRRTQEAMDRIRAAVESAVAGISAFTKSIAKIAAVTEVIDDVTEQTNLLALNAAIIAAQAGRHGQGFAVVATQIKKLADRTAASTKEIGGLVRDFRDQAGVSLGSMSQSQGLVQEGVVLSQRAGEALGSIRKGAADSHLQVQALDKAVREVATGAHQLSATLGEISARAKEISEATHEQEGGLAELDGTVLETRKVADTIAAAVGEQVAAARHIHKQSDLANSLAGESRAVIDRIGEQAGLLSGTIDTLRQIDARERQYFGRSEQDANRLAQQGVELRREIERLKPREGDVNHRGAGRPGVS